jgi:hypothetical protein
MPECRRSNPFSQLSALGIRLFVAAAALACAACATVPVGTPLESNATAAAPGVTPGDTWTYRVRDGFTGLERGTRIFRVTGAGGERINVTVSEGGLDEDHVYDSGWNWLQRPGTNLPFMFTYSPAYQAFAFPLTPGKTWRERLVATSVKDGRRFPVSVDGSVLGWEKVRVPAGEFDAIRVRRIVYFDYFEMMVRGQAQTIEHEWYAPAVKQIVRRETSGMYLSYMYSQRESPFVRTGGQDDGGGPRMVPDDWLISELVSYSVR